jgi:hypothetical protein
LGIPRAAAGSPQAPVQTSDIEARFSWATCAEQVMRSKETPMAQATDTYTQAQFIEDVRQAFASTEDACGQAQAAADHLRRALATGWPENSPQMGKDDGTYVMHRDAEYGHPNPGFMIMAYRQGPQPESPQSPHDHGPCFVVYGVASGGNTQTRFAWRYGPDSTKPPRLEATQQIIQKPGDAAYFLPGEIHATQGSREESTVYVRITSQDLDGVWRHRYHLAHNTSHAFVSGTSPAT